MPTVGCRPLSYSIIVSTAPSLDKDSPSLWRWLLIGTFGLLWCVNKNQYCRLVRSLTTVRFHHKHYLFLILWSLFHCSFKTENWCAEKLEKSSTIKMKTRFFATDWASNIPLIFQWGENLILIAVSYGSKIKNSARLLLDTWNCYC